MKKTPETFAPSAQEKSISESNYTALRALAIADTLGARSGGLSRNYRKGGADRIFIDVAASLLKNGPTPRPKLIAFIVERTGGTPSQARDALDQLTLRRVTENYTDDAGFVFVKMREVTE